MNLGQYLKDLEEIVNIDSGSEDLTGCLQMAAYFANRFEEAGFDVRISREPGIRMWRLGRLRGKATR